MKIEKQAMVEKILVNFGVASVVYNIYNEIKGKYYNINNINKIAINRKEFIKLDLIENCFPCINRIELILPKEIGKYARVYHLKQNLLFMK